MLRGWYSEVYVAGTLLALWEVKRSSDELYNVRN